MKVSQEQKQETRRKIINTAADLFVTDGFDETSMKRIAKEAGVGDATIYKYFPNKDKLILGFYDLRGEEAIKIFHETEDIESYSFQEKCQLIIDLHLEQLMGDREFVEITLKQLLKSPITFLKDELKVATAYKSLFLELLNELDADEQYPDIPMPTLIAGLMTDALLGLTLYWMRDDSEEFNSTTQFSVIAIGIVDSLLKSGIINQFMELFGFLIKSYFVRGLCQGGNLISLMEEFKSTMNQHVKSTSH